MWGKVTCLRKQHDGRDWTSNHRPSDLKSNTLTTTPPFPYHYERQHGESTGQKVRLKLRSTLLLCDIIYRMNRQQHMIHRESDPICLLREMHR